MGEKMKPYASELNFWAMLGNVNALYGRHEWRPFIARKRFEDLFGVQVLPGETCFQLHHASGAYPLAHVSRASMSWILDTLLDEDVRVGNAGGELLDDRTARMIDALGGASRMGACA